MMMYSTLNSLFNEPFFRDFFAEPQRHRPMRPMMPMHLHEEGDAYHLSCELPGVGRDNIGLSVEGDLLTITAQKPAPQWHKPEDKPETARMEHTLQLEGIDTAAITADYVDGVLLVTLPKEKPAQQQQKVQIAIGGAGQVAIEE